MFTKTCVTEEPTDHNPTKEETLGSFLKAARLSQGLDLASIAQATRINRNSLKALEENNRADLPADVFSRGFVKLYASYLKLDPLEAIRFYERQWDSKGNVFPPLGPQNSPPSLAWPGIIISLLLIAIFFGVRIYYPAPSGDSGNHPLQDSPDKNAGEGSPAPQSSSVVAPNEGVDLAPAAAQAIKTADEAALASIKQSEQALADSSSPTPSTLLPPYEIRLQSSKQAKIKLALDGKKVIEKTLHPGSSQAWQATKSFDLTLDNPAGISLLVNSTTIPIATEAGQTVTIHRP